MPDLEREVADHGEQIAVQGQKHHALEHRVKRLEDVSEMLGADISELKSEFADHRVRLEHQYGDLRSQIGTVLPKALASIPTEIYASQKREQDRSTIRWLVITGVATLIGAGAAILGYVAHIYGAG